MLKKIIADAQFRLGRARRDAGLLRQAARNSPQDVRIAVELARLGDPSALGRCLGLVLAGLRDDAKIGSMPRESLAFLEHASRLLPSSHGQFLQDIAALALTGRGRDGFFVEVGTADGTTHSNTLMLERDFGWRGILVEPDRRFHESIRRTRTATLVAAPAFSRDGERMEFLESSRAGALSTLRGFRGADGRHRRGEVRVLETQTLDTILASNGAPARIDFMSIDTEGSELEVLRGLDLRRWDVRFLAIEHNWAPGHRDAIAAHLASFGFRPVLEAFSAMDIWLLRGDE